MGGLLTRPEKRLHFLWVLVLLVAGGCDGCGCGSSGGGDGCSLDLGGDIGCSGDFTPIEDDQGCVCSDGSPCGFMDKCPDDPPPLGSCDNGAPRCGGTCCDGGEVCWFDMCTVVGTFCNSSVDCAQDEVCSFHESFATIDTDICVAPLEGACMPRGDVACDLASLEIASAPTDPDVAWADESVLTPPIVVQLDDDDCNGVVDEGDAPDVVFLTASGVLVAASPTDLIVAETWTDAQVTSPNDPSSHLAAARHEGEMYILSCTDDDRVRAYDQAGGIRWLSEPLSACDAPTIGILDGAASVVAEGGILTLTTGAVVVPFASALSGPPLLVDVDPLTAGNEIVAADAVLAADGSVLGSSGRNGSFVAVADLDGDSVAEIVSIESGAAEHHLTLWQLVAGTPIVIRMDVDVHAALPDACQPGDPGADRSGGPPAIADFTGDGNLDIAVAGARGVVVFDGLDLLNVALSDAEAVVAEIPLPDCQHGRRAVSAFDFDDNGIAEIVARDDHRVHILNAVDSATLWSACAPSDASYGATPIVDVDRDGSAEILAVASALSGTTCDGATSTGVEIFHHDAGGWAGAPGQWLQHADPSASADGTLEENAIPLGARSTPSSRDAADLRVSLTAPCTSTIDLLVENRGAQPVPLGSAFVRIYGTAGDTSTDIALVPVPVTLEAGARVTLQHPMEGVWEGVTAVLEHEPGREVYACASSSMQTSVACN